jgi:hypothetical protein
MAAAVFTRRDRLIESEPLMIGWILDLSGGMSATGWGLAFLHVAAVALVGQIAFTALRPRDLAEDQPLSAASTRAGRPR